MYHSDCFELSLTVKHRPFKRVLSCSCFDIPGRIAQPNNKHFINPHSIAVRKTGVGLFHFDNILGEADYIATSLPFHKINCGPMYKEEYLILGSLCTLWR